MFCGTQQLIFILMHALQQARREIISMAWNIYPRYPRKVGEMSQKIYTHYKVELIIELNRELKPGIETGNVNSEDMNFT